MINKTRTRALRGAVVAGAMALLMGPVGIAQAATTPVNFNLTAGSVTVAALGAPAEIPAGTASASGEWDATTGAFTGTLTVDPIVQTVSGIPANLVLSSTGVSGTIPADGSNGSVTVAGAKINVVVTALGVDCSLDLGDISFVAVLNASATPPTLALDGEFTVTNPPVATATCPDSVIALLGQAGVTFPLAVGMSLDFAQGEAPAPEPQPQPQPEPEPEVVEEVVEAAPTFTG